MTKPGEMYKCEICGNLVSVVESGQGKLVCCGQPMKLLKEQTKEQEGNEKHVPVIERVDNGIKVKIGSIPHPMEEKHYIEWIEIIADGKVCKKFLKPGDTPEVQFEVKAEKIEAREYCSVHGLWKSTK
ncbi:MAG: desulfoferrodoxin [Nanoarchaeota archaeon]|nr:desulfoferrodoxin [Nanoarchaeota archaeon]